MATLSVMGNGFMSRTPSTLTIGSVNADPVVFVLDGSWDGLTVFAAFRNDTEGVERHVLLGDDLTCTIPWECLTQAGTLNIGLLGLRGSDVVKPTIWKQFGKVVQGVDPEAGDDPQPPTPSWEQQMVEQATQAKQAAQAAQEAAEDAAESAASAGPYEEEAKKSAEAANASQEAAATSAQQASQAAQDAQTAAGSIGDAVQRAEQAATAAGTAQRAAETAQTAAAQSAGTAQGAATTAGQAAQTAQGAATQASQYLASVEADAQAAANAATAAGKSQEAAKGAAQEAGNSKNQANTAANAAKVHADAAGTSKVAAERAAETAGNAQSDASKSAKSAANSAKEAEDARLEAQKAAAILPAPTQEDAGKAVLVNPEGDGYTFADGALLQEISGENYGSVIYNFPEDYDTFWVVGTLDVAADGNTVVFYQNVRSQDVNSSLKFWDYYGQGGKRISVSLCYKRVRIGGTSLLKVEGLIANGDYIPGNKITPVESSWGDKDSDGRPLIRFRSISISGTFSSVNLKIYGR